MTVRLRQERIHAQRLCGVCRRELKVTCTAFERSVTFEGNLSEEQHARLQEIAHKCPVHKTLTSPIVIAELKNELAADFADDTRI